MNQYISLFLTLIAGLFFLFGLIITKRSHNKEKLSYFSIALAFIVMLNLIFFDLGPEILELFEINIFSKNIIIVIILIILGGLILQGLDLFIPDHHHEHKDHEKNIKEHNSHAYHIGVVTLISLLIHNILEGMAIYGVSVNDIKLGSLMCLSVALHNIPLGIEISLSLNALKEKGKKNILLLFILSISSLLGGIIVFLFGELSEIFLGVVTCLTLGMLIYIAFKELLPELVANRKNKEIHYGIIVGIIIIIFTLFL